MLGTRKIFTTAALAGGLLTAGLLTAGQASAFVGADAEIALGPAGRSAAVTPVIQQGIAPGNGTRMVTYGCTAVATGDAVSTALTRCALLVNGVVFQNQPLALPGPTVASGGTALQIRSGSTVSVCATAAVTFADSSRLGVSKCTAPVRIVAPLVGAISE